MKIPISIFTNLQFYIAHVIMNGVDSIERIVLYIDSSQRTAGTPENFSLTLAMPIAKILQVEVIGAEIPYTFYTVNTATNRLAWTSGATAYTCTVTPGNYAVSQFVTALQNAMNAQQTGWTVTYSSQTYKLTFARATTFTLDLTNAAGASTMSGLIGMTASTASGTVTTLPNVINLGGPRYLLIKSTKLTRPKLTRPFLNASQNDVLYKVPVTGGPGAILVEKNTYSNMLRYGVRQVVQTIDFQLVDDQDNPVNLNGANWSLSVNLLPG